MTRSGKPFDEAAFAASCGPELIAKLQAKEHEARLIHAEILDIVADLEREGIPQLAGHRPAGLISEALHLAPKQASLLVKHAALVAESLTPTGHTTPAALPTVRQVLRDGVIDGEHIDAVADTLKQLPDDAPLGARELVESTLAEAARTLTPHAVREQGRELLAVLDPDGTRPTDEDKLAEPRNSFSYRLDHKGRMAFRGELEPEAADVLQEMLHKHGGPDGTADVRSQRERHGDVVSNLIHAAARPVDNGSGSGGTAVELTVFMNLEVLTDAVGTATLASACRLAPA